MSVTFRFAGIVLCLLSARIATAQYAYDYNSGFTPDPLPSHSGYSFASDVKQPATATDVAPAPVAGGCACDGGSNPCGSCCDLCSCGCGPLWTVKVGAVYMTRATASPGVLIEDFNTGAPLLSAQDFNFNWAAGPDISISRALGGYSSFEARYFNIDGWQAQQAFTTPGFWNFVTEPPLVGVGVADLTATYASHIDSLELNFRQQAYDRLAWLVGFRWVQLNEDLSFDADFSGNRSLVVTDTNNHLYGGQIGLDWRIFDRGGPFAIESVFKAGVFGNSANNHFTLAQDIGPAFRASDSNGQVAFVGEIGVTGVYQWTDHIALRGGYQLLWLEGIAVASDQLAVTDVLTESGIDTRGGVFYHGALMSVDVTW